jgi:salicylate hydroxylase
MAQELGDQNRWGLYDHAPAENFSRGRIAMMGDAAHASTPHQGAGAGQGIEDAYIMASLLAHSSIKTDVDIPRAFKAFDAVRRPRSQRVVSTSREQGHLYDFELLGVEDDVEKIGALLRTRSTWIWDVDLGKHLADAVAIMDQASTKY